MLLLHEGQATGEPVSKLRPACQGQCCCSLVHCCHGDESLGIQGTLSANHDRPCTDGSASLYVLADRRAQLRTHNSLLFHVTNFDQDTLFMSICLYGRLKF